MFIRNYLWNSQLSKVSVLKSCLVVAALFLCVACSPKLDWRTVQSPQEGYVALFPGKPDRLERHIQYQDQDVFQTLEAIKIDRDIYSISALHLNQDQIGLMPQLLNQLKDNLLKGVGTDDSSPMTTLSYFQTVDRQRLPVEDYFLDFKSKDVPPQAMRVRWVIRINPSKGAWIYQVSVLHQEPVVTNIKEFFSQESYANFFEEFHPD